MATAGLLAIAFIGTALAAVPGFLSSQVPSSANPPGPPGPPDFREPEIPDEFDVVDVEAVLSWSTEILADGTEVEFTGSAHVEFAERPPQEDVGYRLTLFLRNHGPGSISVEDFVFSYATTPFAKGALAEHDIENPMLGPGDEAEVTVVIFVDRFFFDPQEDVFKLNAHHLLKVRDSSDDVRHLGMNVMFRA